MATPQNDRVHERVRIGCWVTLSVDGRQIWARAAEMSGAGATIVSLLPVAVRSLVKIRSRVDLLVGGAHVRYCERKGLLYRIGVEFARPVAARF